MSFREDLDILAHYLSGLLSCLSVLIHPVLSAVGFAGFLLYEMSEAWGKDAWFDQELREFMSGFFIGVAVLLVVEAVW